MSKMQILTDALNKMMKYALIYMSMLFIYFTFMHRQAEDIEGYAKSVVGQVYLSEKTAWSDSRVKKLKDEVVSINSKQLLVVLENDTAAIRCMQNMQYKDSLEDTNVIFGSNVKNSIDGSAGKSAHERLWVEVKIDGVRADVIKWDVAGIGDGYIECKAELKDYRGVYVLVRYDVRDSMIYVTTEVINDSAIERNVQVLACMYVDEKKCAEYMYSTGFLSGKKDGFNVKRLNGSSLRSSVYKKDAQGWFGIIRKYWLVAVHGMKGYIGAIDESRVNCADGMDKVSSYDIAEVDFEKREVSAFELNAKMYFVSGSEKAKVDIKQKFVDKVCVYAGPKHSEEVCMAEKCVNDTGLLKTMDYGWFSWINALIRMVMEWLLEVCGRADYALLAFVAIIRLALLVPYIISEKHARLMVLLDDKVKRIKEHYMSEQIVEKKIAELYASYGVNKYITSFPMVVQLFWFIPLNIISQLFIFRGAAFFGLSIDMGALDPTSWTNLFGIMPWNAVHIPWINFGWWVVLFTLTYLISEDLGRMEKMFVVFMIVSTVVFYKNLPVLFTIFWCIVNVIGAVQTRLFKILLHPRIELKKVN